MVTCACGYQFLPDAMAAHVRSCEACKTVVTKEVEVVREVHTGVDKEAYEAALRRANELEAALSAAHAEAAAAEAAAQKAAEEAAAAEAAKRKAAEEAAARAKAEAAAKRKAAEEAAAKAEAEAKAKAEATARAAAEAAARASQVEGDRYADMYAAATELIPCELCGRKFFPDRLAVHLRVCRRKYDKRMNG